MNTFFLWELEDDEFKTTIRFMLVNHCYFRLTHEPITGRTFLNSFRCADAHFARKGAISEIELYEVRGYAFGGAVFVTESIHDPDRLFDRAINDSQGAAHMQTLWDEMQLYAGVLT